MLNLLVKFVFKIITKIFDLIFSPLFAGINALFPSVSQYFGYISQFLTTALTYFATTARLALVPQGALLLLFDYFAIKYTIFITVQGIKFIMMVYDKLKP